MTPTILRIQDPRDPESAYLLETLLERPSRLGDGAVRFRG